MEKRHLEIAYNLMRIALGINIFLHGAVRLGPNFIKFHTWILSIFESSILPSTLVSLSAYFIVGAEIVIGLFLIIGVFALPALVAGLLLMIMLMSGMALIQKWDAVSLQLTYIFYYSVLIALVSQSRKFWPLTLYHSKLTKKS